MAAEMAKWLSDLILDEDQEDWESTKEKAYHKKGKKGGKASRHTKQTNKQK